MEIPIFGDEASYINWHIYFTDKGFLAKDRGTWTATALGRIASLGSDAYIAANLIEADVLERVENHTGPLTDKADLQPFNALIQGLAGALELLQTYGGS